MYVCEDRDLFVATLGRYDLEWVANSPDKLDTLFTEGYPTRCFVSPSEQSLVFDGSVWTCEDQLPGWVEKAPPLSVGCLLQDTKFLWTVVAEWSANVWVIRSESVGLYAFSDGKTRTLYEATLAAALAQFQRAGLAGPSVEVKLWFR